MSCLSKQKKREGRIESMNNNQVQFNELNQVERCIAIELHKLLLTKHIIPYSCGKH